MLKVFSFRFIKSPKQKKRRLVLLRAKMGELSLKKFSNRQNLQGFPFPILILNYIMCFTLCFSSSRTGHHNFQNVEHVAMKLLHFTWFSWADSSCRSSHIENLHLCNIVRTFEKMASMIHHKSLKKKHKNWNLKDEWLRQSSTILLA